MSLDKIIAQIKQNNQSLPPVEQWNPAYCGEIDIEIKADGSWYYNDSIFKRMSLVKLLASVLKLENDEYFFVTPIEKIKISVADVPFVITQWRWLENCAEPTMLLTTNLGDELLLDAEHPLVVNDDGVLYVTVRRNLKARVHRNVYYQWIDQAEEVRKVSGLFLQLTSAGQQFSLGQIE